MSGKSPQSTGSARAGAVRAIKTANPGRGVIFMDVLHGTWGSLGESKAFSSEVETGSRQENASPVSILSKRGSGIDPGPTLGIRSVLNDSIPWLTSAAGLLKRSDAPSCDSLWSRVSRARAAADRAAGGGHGRGHAACRNRRRDGAGGVAASDRGISPQAQGISGSARGVRAGGQRLLELDCREAAGPQRQAARSPVDRARRLCADAAAGLCRTEAAGGPIAIGD